MGKKKAKKPRTAQLPAADHDPTAAQHHAHQLPDLPEAVLTAILQRVPLWHRLSACALVCRSWALAVASTTADVSAFFEAAEDCRQMQSWLQLWAGQVASINLHYSMEPGSWKEVDPFQSRLLLPSNKLTQLTSLFLSRISVVFHTQQHGGVSTRSRQRASVAQSLAVGSSAGAATLQRMRPSGPPAAAAPAAAASFLPALRELMLVGCKTRHDSFLQLSQLTQLTSLHLHQVVMCTAGWAPVAVQQASKAVTAVLQHLQGLERLELLEGVVLQDPAAALAPLSTMQRLQRAGLSSDACSTAALALLPTSLTRLDLCECDDGFDEGPGPLRVTTSSLPKLPLLRVVHLRGVNLQPGVLACWSSLTQLYLGSVELQGSGTAGDESDDDWGDWRERRRAFCGALSKLTHLQDLSLHGLDLCSVPDLQLLSALTASTQLKQLTLTEGGRGDPYPTLPLPKRALQHMFAPPKQWPLLQTLRLDLADPDEYRDEEDWCVDAADISRLASCLPALSSLFLLSVVKDYATVAALTQLVPGLTHLSVAGEFFDDGAASFLAQLTSLKQLEWSDTEVTSVGLKALTALTNLDALVLLDCPRVSEHMLNSDVPYLNGNALELYTSEEAEAAGTSDVWKQLKQLCRHEHIMRLVYG